MKSHTIIALSTAIAGIWFPTHGWASPLFELVGGAQGMGGFNARVSSPGAASTYFNPALLADAAPGLELGTFFLDESIDISVDSRESNAQCRPGDVGTSCDIPVVFGTGPESFRHEDGSPISNPAIPTGWLEQGRQAMGTDPGLTPSPRQSAGSGQNQRAYQMLGLVSPVFGRRAVLGFYAMIPLAEFTTAKAFYNDEREQYFSNSLHPEMYSDRMTATSLAFGVGSRITDRLAAGITFTLSLKNTASAPVYVSDLANLDTVLLDSDIGVEAAVSPHFGLTYDPLRRLRLAATVHTKQAMEIVTGFDYFLSTGSKQGASVGFTHAYIPLTAAVAGDYDLVDVAGGRVHLAGTAKFARWSQYRDRHSESPHPDYAWSDTLSGALGARYQRGNLRGLIDLEYQPTPVPPQTGRSNYVDSDRLSLSTGADYTFRLWGSTFRAGVGVQSHRLLSQHVSKFDTPINPQPNSNLPGYGDGYYPQLVLDEVPDDAIDGIVGDPIPERAGLQSNNPGFPGWASEGWILGGTVNIAVLY